MGVPVSTARMPRSQGEILRGVHLLASSILQYFEFRASKVLTPLDTGAVAVVFGLFLYSLFPRAIERFI